MGLQRVQEAVHGERPPLVVDARLLPRPRGADQHGLHGRLAHSARGAELRDLFPRAAAVHGVCTQLLLSWSFEGEGAVGV